MTASTFDVVITGGRYFDGTGGPSALRDIGIKNGRIAAVSETPLQYQGTPKVIDAFGHWITPGFLDTHTHYDAEMIVAPSLSESVRHGDENRRGGRRIVCRVGGASADRMRAVGRRRRVPARGIWRRAVGSHRHAVDQQLDPGHGDVIRRCGAQGDQS